MEESIFNSNPRNCFCTCNYPKPMYCPMNCCCSCIYFLHESSPNLTSKFCHINESQPLLIPRKEREIFDECQSDIKKSPSTPNKYIQNKKQLDMDKDNKHFSSRSNIINLNLDLEQDINKKIKQRNRKKISKIKTTNNEIEIDKYFKYKKIKVNKKNQERAITSQNSNKNQIKKRKIDMNNYIPLVCNKNGKGKYINNYELNKNSMTTKSETSINNKNIDNIKYINNKKKKVNNFNEFKSKYNSLMTSKLQMGDLNDDIIDIKHNYSTIENNENKEIMENLKNEIEQSKKAIKFLKKENEVLKMKLYEKEQIEQKEIEFKKKEIAKVNKSTNTSHYKRREKDKNNDNNNDENKRQFIIQKSLFEKEVYNLKNEVSEITFKLNEYENFIAILKTRNSDLENVIKKKDNEISQLKIKLDNLEKENKNKINEFNDKIEIIKEKDNISSDYKMNNNNNLRLDIIKLNEIIAHKDKKLKDLELKFKYEKKYDNKNKLILNLLFNFYTNVKKLINFEKSKEILKDIIEIMGVDDFEYKLNRVEKRLKQILDDIQIKYGHCFACDIACCTSHVDKLKSFRNNIISKK